MRVTRGGSPLILAGAFPGNEMSYDVGEITQGRDIFLYSRSPLSEPVSLFIVFSIKYPFDVGENTQERSCNIDTLVLPSLSGFGCFVFFNLISCRGEYTGRSILSTLVLPL